MARADEGNGLYLHVEPSRARWVQRLVVHGKLRALGLGSFALVPLAEAREQALANRRLARAGGDPRASEHRAPGIPTFEEAVDKVLAIHGATWRAGGKNAQRWRATLGEYAYPRLGGKGIDRVTSADVMAVLQPIWTRKHATAQQVRQRIGAVMKWAIAQGYRNDNPAGDAVTAALPKRPVAARHQRALPHGEVAEAIAAVRGSAAGVELKLVFELLVLTASRSSEVRLATWGEMDIGARVWTVAAARMKTGRKHRVPLCERAVEVLGQARRLRGDSTRVAPAGLGGVLVEVDGPARLGVDAADGDVDVRAGRVSVGGADRVVAVVETEAVERAGDGRQHLLLRRGRGNTAGGNRRLTRMIVSPGQRTAWHRRIRGWLTIEMRRGRSGWSTDGVRGMERGTGPGVHTGPTTMSIWKRSSRSLHPATTARTAADATHEGWFVPCESRGSS